MNHFDWLRRWIEGLGQLSLMARDLAVSIFTVRPNWRDLLYQSYSLGVKSQSVVLITGAFTGMVMAAQTYFQFHRVRLDTATMAVVSVSMCSELGPVLTGLMVAGRVGAALAAELGTMRVTEQIDALRTLATNPIDYLIVPRFLATLSALPILTAASIALGILAGFTICVTYLGVEPAYLWHNMVTYTQPHHLIMGLIKSIIYGGLIALISCYKGLTCAEGAEGVGHATTEAVVYSAISILVSNFFLTLILNRVLTT